jgi:hypothetical protein
MGNYDWEDEGMQSEAQMHTGAIEAGWSSTEDPETCACHGGGWILSQLDTFHQCPVHFAGQRHPEDYEDEGEDAPMGSEPPCAEPVALVEDHDDYPNIPF